MGYLILFGWLILLPICSGAVLPYIGGKESGSEQKTGYSVMTQWMCGQVLLWAVFQLISVWFVLQKGTLKEVVSCYTAAAIVLGIAGVCNMFFSYHKRKALPFQKTNYGQIKKQRWLVFIVAVLWLVEMLLLVCLAVNDGDDSFYMAVAQKAEEADSLYTANVYAYGATELNYRYALAPFPIWIAYLSRISGVHTLTIGHIVLGMMLVTMSEVAYAQMGKVLFGENLKKRIQFLIFVELLYIWGNTSSHTAESFLLLRSRQGKALVAGVVFPIMFALLLWIGQQLEQKNKLSGSVWIFAASVILTGCLGSTLGGTLVLLLWASALFLLAVGYRKIYLLVWGAVSAVPALIYALLYLLHR